MTDERKTMTVTKFPETNKRRRGHNFYPPKSIASKIPALYGTEHLDGGDKVVHLHYFTGASDWYVVEYDPESGLAFGWVCLNGDTHNAEWGYMSLSEMEEVRTAHGPFTTVIERDCYWSKKTMGEVFEKRGHR